MSLRHVRCMDHELWGRVGRKRWVQRLKRGAGWPKETEYDASRVGALTSPGGTRCVTTFFMLFLGCSLLANVTDE